ncbi:Venom acid phosphatase Acph-1 [Temnothorax longispinosus]|uniref:acid phosphatase n=1 Tax=Temnothorax longispinosus TaxID=300112 RepID=A0A4S2JWH7_9HYME|nr:Venom acid phosphatase Acph-1 [Temnothorax longispinosus]
MFLTLSTIFTVFLSSLAVSVNPDVELQLLHVVFRHGDKVPHREFQNYPNDPHRDQSYHPMGNGGLTNQGKMREYKIGTMLRERYDQYFGPDYWPTKIYARSTEVPRTQMSLQLVLAGLFPPSEKQTWNPHLPWIPSWTYFVPYKTDNLLFPHYCYRYREEYQRFLQRESAKEMINKYKNVMDYLTDHTGKLINDTDTVGHLYNLLKEEVIALDIRNLSFAYLSPQVLLWTGVTEQLIVQTIPGCAEICPFEDFLNIVKDILPSDDEYYCRREDLKPNAHHRSSADCIADNGSWWYIFLTVLLTFTSKFTQK